MQLICWSQCEEKPRGHFSEGFTCHPAHHWYTSAIEQESFNNSLSSSHFSDIYHTLLQFLLVFSSLLPAWVDPGFCEGGCRSSQQCFRGVELHSCSQLHSHSFVKLASVISQSIESRTLTCSDGGIQESKHLEVGTVSDMLFLSGCHCKLPPVPLMNRSIINTAELYSHNTYF